MVLAIDGGPGVPALPQSTSGWLRWLARDTSLPRSALKTEPLEAFQGPARHEDEGP